MRSPIIMPVLAGLLTGLGLLALYLYVPLLNLCFLTFLIIALLMAIFAPLTSGPAFGGWIKASTTAIDGMNADIRSRARLSISERMGAVLYFAVTLLTYYLLKFFMDSMQK